LIWRNFLRNEISELRRIVQEGNDEMTFVLGMTIPSLGIILLKYFEFIKFEIQKKYFSYSYSFMTFDLIYSQNKDLFLKERLSVKSIADKGNIVAMAIYGKELEHGSDIKSRLSDPVE
jgi:hypothetical protein